MSLLKWFLPDEWVLKLSTPSEDSDETKAIFLHLIDRDISLQLQKEVSRSELIEFLKQIHDDYESIEDNFIELANQYIQFPMHLNVKVLNVFKKEQIVFMNSSELEIEHNKNDEDLWITDILINNGGTSKKIAYIATKQLVAENFSHSDLNDLD